MKRFGKYLLEKQLAIGGMAEIFLARQQGPAGFEKTLVVKRILPHFANDEQFIQMFLDEARTAAKLNHPNIVQIYELGETEGSYYIAMEYIRGESLAKVIRRLRQHGMHMPLHLAAKIVASVCAGLDYAHHFAGADGQPLGLVHRDISPDNILVSYDGSVKMIDFGIAKARDNESKTQAGSVKGKFCYMSPEQVTGKRLDRRSDIFSLGIVLHELTTLEKPFGSDADLMTVSAIVNDPPKSAADLVEGYPAALWEIISKTLSKDRGQRYDTAHEMGISLERFIHSRGEFLSDRDIGNYLRKLFSEETAAIDELREMASGIRSRIIVPPKTGGFSSDPSPEDATAIGAPASEDRTQAVPIDTGTESRTPTPKRSASIPIGRREPSIPGAKLPPPSQPQSGPNFAATSVAPIPNPVVVRRGAGPWKWVILVLVLGGLAAGGWFGWQYYQGQEAAKAPPSGQVVQPGGADAGADGTDSGSPAGGTDGAPPVITGPAETPDAGTTAPEAPDAAVVDAGAPDVVMAAAADVVAVDVVPTVDVDLAADIAVAVDVAPPDALVVDDTSVLDASTDVATAEADVAVAAADVAVIADVPQPPDVLPTPDVPPVPDVAVVPEVPDVMVVPDIPAVPDVAPPPIDAGPAPVPDVGPIAVPDVATPKPDVVTPKPVTQYGSITIAAPDGAQVLLDGRRISSGTHKVTYGTHRVEIIKDGQKGVKTVKIDANKPNQTIR
ncbi:MAG: protein kinase [Myxococcales bacterium]|nr:protein kinase [Myxococcales bacterium]